MSHVYRIKVWCECAWDDYAWCWKVSDLSGNVIDSGSGCWRWSSHWKAKRAAKAAATGKYPKPEYTKNLDYTKWLP